jgi:hypothetical protein
VPPDDEYRIFSESDRANLHDASGHYWGIRDASGKALGTCGERLAKFPVNQVPAVPWHGYPVSPASGRPSEIPPDDFVEGLVETGVITRTLGRKIQKRKA